MTIENKLGENKKLYSLDEAVRKRDAYRQEGKKLVLTNGCFDMLHPGHLSYLKDARGLGDVLWVALNSSRSVSELKGPSRPIFNDEERAYALGALESVDGVVVFDTARLTGEIEALKPDVYVKAGDYTLETLNQEERRALEGVDAEIKFMPFVEGYSTTAIIEKIQS